MRIISVPMESIEGAEDLKIMCGGYFSLKAEKNGVVYISDKDIENWRQTGEFTYNKVKSDLGIEAMATSGGFWHGNKAVIYAPGTDTSYLAELSEDGTTFVTLKEDDGWYIADARGYCTYVSREDNTFYYTIEKPDGSTTSGKASGEPDENNALVHLKNSYQGDYVLLYTICKKSEQTANGRVYTYGLYGLDANGTETKLCEVENVTSADAPTNYDYIFSEKFTKTDGTVTRLCVDTSGRLIAIDASTVIPQIPGYALNSVLSIFGDSAILEYIGEDESDLRYVLCGIGKDGSFSILNDKVYTYLQPMNDRCYNMGEFTDNTEPLIFERDGIWGYVSKNGEEIATFDNAIGFGNSEYAVAIQDGKSFLVDRQMNRVSEDFECDYVNSKGGDLFIVQKDGVNYLATYVAPGDGAYDSAGGSAGAPDESKGNPDTGVVVCMAAPIIAGSVLTAVLTRKRK